MVSVCLVHLPGLGEVQWRLPRMCFDAVEPLSPTSVVLVGCISHGEGLG